MNKCAIVSIGVAIVSAGVIIYSSICVHAGKNKMCSTETVSISALITGFVAFGITVSLSGVFGKFKCTRGHNYTQLVPTVVSTGAIIS